MIDPTWLREVSMFQQLSDERLEEVMAALRRRHLQAGEVLFHQGDAGDEMFIVQAGSVAIFAPDDDRPGEEKPIRIFREGEVLGEMALIDRQPRSASAHALEPAWVLVLSGDDFRRLLRDDPELAFAVMAGLNERIRYTTDFLSQVRDWVQQITQGRYEQPMQAGGDYRDRTLGSLAAEFAQMATQVKQREDALRQEITLLKIEIDEAKLQRQVDEIVESDFFRSLKAQAQSMRRREE